MLCGGTLALNQNGELLAWARKPGSQPTGGGPQAADEQSEGHGAPRRRFSTRWPAGSGPAASAPPLGGERGLLARSIPPLTSRTVDGALRFELSPHFGINDDAGRRRKEAAHGR